ncbi:MAG: ammonia-forming cytochrome c nitrite reductase subunit c552 [Nitrospinota bacterium]
MKHLTRRLALLVCWTLFETLSLSSPASAKSVCIECHKTLKAAMRVPVEKWEPSIHRNAGVTCVDCHGGNPLSKKLAMEKSSGFTGAPLREEIPELCARCHSDIKKMRKYNLRTDQFSEYKTSVHGIKLYSEENEYVPTCVDCHNSHAVFSKNNPASPVYRFNIPKTCNTCHGDEERMEEYEGPTNQLSLYKDSVHGKKLFDEENLKVPTCVDCHGNHGATRRGFPSAGAACKTCHAGIFEYYKKSPHVKLEKGKPGVSCVQCHGNHRIEKPSHDKFSGSGPTDCAACHPQDTSEYSVGIAIQTRIQDATLSISNAKGLFTGLANKQGAVFNAEELEKKITRAETLLADIVPVTHSLRTETVEKSIKKILLLSESASDEIENELSKLNFRKLFLFISWVFIIITIALLNRLIKTLS